jgi:hypothetical protein
MIAACSWSRSLSRVDHIDENDFRSRSVEWDSCDDNIDSGKCATLDLGIGIFPDPYHLGTIIQYLFLIVQIGSEGSTIECMIK